MNEEPHRCEICGDLAVVSVLDYMEVKERNGLVTRKSYGNIHRFCETHRRGSECQATEDQMLSLRSV